MASGKKVFGYLTRLLRYEARTDAKEHQKCTPSIFLLEDHAVFDVCLLPGFCFWNAFHDCLDALILPFLFGPSTTSRPMPLRCTRRILGKRDSR